MAPGTSKRICNDWLTHLEMVDERLEAPVSEAGTPETETGELLPRQRVGVYQVEGIFVTSAEEGEAAEPTASKGGIQPGPLGLTADLLAADCRREAGPQSGTPVEQVPPLGAHLDRQQGINNKVV